MASVEETRELLGKAEEQLRKAEEQLRKAEVAITKFEQDEDGGQWLTILRRKMRTGRLSDDEKQEKERLERKEKGLEEKEGQLRDDVRNRTKHVEELRFKLMSAAQTEIESSKRRLVPERTEALCEVLIQPFNTLPTSANELLNFINTALLSKLPVAFSEDLTDFREILDHIDYDDTHSKLARTISNALSETYFVKANTEMDLTTPVDVLTRRPLELLCNNSGFQIDFMRNASDRGTTTNVKSTPATKKQMRPDLLGYINNLLVIKGEEKRTRTLLEAARGELLSKFSKFDPICFGRIKYMICYAVAKDVIGFYAIDGDNKQLVSLSETLDVGLVGSRFKILKTIVNIARIFKTMITNKAFPDDLFPIGKPVELGHSSITFYEDYVYKKVSVSDSTFDEHRVQTLREMYEIARGYDGLVQVLEGPFYQKDRSTGKYKYSIKLRTRGYKRVPRDEPTTLAMTRSLLTGLARLHRCNYVHRDIRLPNIVYDLQNREGYEYVLIDFEHGGYVDEIFNTLLTQWDLGTLDHKNAYTTLSEMYQLGKLLEMLNTVTSDEGRDFISKLKDKRMEADTALQHQWIAQEYMLVT